jgi:ariadne-1
MDVPESAPGEPPNTLSLGCKHKFCIDCWKEYLERKIMNEAESGRLQCMETGCGRIVGERVVLRLVSETAADRCVSLIAATWSGYL